MNVVRRRPSRVVVFAIGISLLVHAVLLPFVHAPAAARTPKAQPPAIITLRHVPRPPKPRPTPIPPPATPRPVVARPAVVPRHVHVVHVAPHDAVVTQAVSPDRPQSAIDEDAVGRVVVEVQLSRDGSVVHAGVHTSSGFASLDRAAVEAAAHARYAPASDGCETIAGTYLYVVDFTE
jgi:protein TonB